LVVLTSALACLHIDWGFIRLGDGTIAGKIRSYEDGSGAQAFRAYSRHSRSHSESPPLVRSCADDGAGAFPSDDHGLAAQLRIIALLDRCIKRVHIDMDDFSHDRSAIRN
jgi:hypothetical protein